MCDTLFFQSIAEGWLATDPPVLGLDGDIGINQTILYSFFGEYIFLLDYHTPF